MRCLNLQEEYEKLTLKCFWLSTRQKLHSFYHCFCWFNVEFGIAVIIVQSFDYNTRKLGTEFNASHYARTQALALCKNLFKMQGWYGNFLVHKVKIIRSIVKRCFNSKFCKLRHIFITFSSKTYPLSEINQIGKFLYRVCCKYSHFCVSTVLWCEVQNFGPDQLASSNFN